MKTRRRCEMRQLYEQILVDHEKRRFYAKCETSGEKRYSVKLPLSCRGEELLQLLEEFRIAQQAVLDDLGAAVTEYLIRQGV